MTGLAFIPHLEPQSDFLVVLQDSERIRDTMRALGATVVERDDYTAYLWSSRLGDRFLIGLGVLDGQLMVGPRRLREMPSRLGAGSYTIVELSSHAAVVQPDLFGMNTTYYSDGLVTNRLHLAGLVSRMVDAERALSVTYNDGGFSFSFNTFTTPVREVALLPAGARVEVGAGGLRVVQEETTHDFGTLEVDDYWTLIERGAQEVVDNVTAVVDSGLPVFADITGGRDSRVVFGALVAAGRQHEVIFNTIANPTTAGLQADLEIGTGLVSLYGGAYSERPRAVGYAQHSIDQNLVRRRSQVFGAYHWITPSDVRPYASLTKTPMIRMLGGGGELYRDYWKPMLFTSIDADERATDDVVRSMLERHRGTSLGPQYFEQYVPDLLDTFRALPGESVGHKLDAHYLNFRNRFHFGPRQSSPETMSTINVATSPSLLAASRGLPARERAAGRVLFDVIQSFDAKLAYLPFDKPGDPQILSSPYHRPSPHGEAPLALQPATHLAMDVADRRPFLRPTLPGSADWTFEDILDAEISLSLEILSDPSSGFSFMVDDELRAHVEWAKNYSPRNRSSLASKLRGFADYSAL